MNIFLGSQPCKQFCSLLFVINAAGYHDDIFNPHGKGSDAMNDFLQGFVKGAMETPKGFFAPVIAVWRLMVDVTESLINEKVETPVGKGRK